MVKNTYQDKAASFVRGKGLALTLGATNFPKKGNHSQALADNTGAEMER
jgi:hypothetical protein